MAHSFKLHFGYRHLFKNPFKPDRCPDLFYCKKKLGLRVETASLQRYIAINQQIDMIETAKIVPGLIQ